jgi:hypothetical protein
LIAQNLSYKNLLSILQVISRVSNLIIIYLLFFRNLIVYDLLQINTLLAGKFNLKFLLKFTTSLDFNFKMPQVKPKFNLNFGWIAQKLHNLINKQPRRLINSYKNFIKIVCWSQIYKRQYYLNMPVDLICKSFIFSNRHFFKKKFRNLYIPDHFFKIVISKDMRGFVFNSMLIWNKKRRISISRNFWIFNRRLFSNEFKLPYKFSLSTVTSYKVNTFKLNFRSTTSTFKTYSYPVNIIYFNQLKFVKPIIAASYYNTKVITPPFFKFLQSFINLNFISMPDIQSHSINLNFKIQIFKISSSALLNMKPLNTRLLFYFKRRSMNFEKLFARSFTRFNMTSNSKSLYSINDLLYNTKINATAFCNSYVSNVYKGFQFRLRSNSAVWASKVNLRRITWQRREFLFFYRKKMVYQNKLTRFIFKFYRLKFIEFMYFFEFNVVWILLKSRLIYHKSTLEQLQKFNAIYINNSLISNNTFLKLNLNFFDTLQIIVCAKIYIFLMWDKFVYIYKYRRFLFYVYKWRVRRFRPYPKDSSYRIPNWVLNIRFFQSSIPFFFEVDYITLTVILLHFKYHDFDYFVSTLLTISPIGAVRNHNWKAIV